MSGSALSVTAPDVGSIAWLGSELSALNLHVSTGAAPGILHVFYGDRCVELYPVAKTKEELVAHVIDAVNRWASLR